MSRFPFFTLMVRFLSVLVLGSLGALHLHGEEATLWTCGMHPQIIKSEPGNCPICEMKLTPIRRNNAQNSLQIDAATVQRMNLKTDLVGSGPVRREIRTVGTIAYNEEGLRDITLKYEAWLEKLTVGSNWAKVREGDPLAELYSPDLYNAELNFVVARRSEGENGGPLTEAALVRLQLLDLPADEIATLSRTLEVPRTRILRSPNSGVVLERMALAGQMMKPGERLYRIADLSKVWVIAQVYESDLAFVSEGQSAEVHLSYGQDSSFSGVIERLLPQVDEQTRTVSARIVVDNAQGSLRPGMFAEVKLHTQLRDKAILVPEIAVLRTGERNTVFVAREGGFFDPREVKLGLRSQGGFYEVLDGLREGERIVVSGQFMLDSESQLREAIQKMIKAEAVASPAPKAAPSPEAVAGSFAAALPAGVELYACPMEEDVDATSDKPGRCPKCNMKLQPLSELEPAHRQAAEQAWLKNHAASAHTH